MNAVLYSNLSNLNVLETHFKITDILKIKVTLSLKPLYFYNCINVSPQSNILHFYGCIRGNF